MNRVRRICLAGLVSILAAMAFATAVQAASPAWMILATNGPTHLPPRTSEVQRVAVDATGGSYTLTFAGQTTTAIPFNASPMSVEAALEVLSTVGAAGGSVAIEGGPGDTGASDPYFVSFGGSLAGSDVSQMTSTPTLTGGAATATVTTHIAGGTPGTGTIAVYPRNIGGAPTSGSYTVQLTLPAGIATSATPTGVAGWSCAPSGAGQSSTACTRTTPVRAGQGSGPIRVPVTVASVVPRTATVDITITGGAASTGATSQLPVTVSQTPAQAGIQTYFAGAFDENGLPETRAGAHPDSSVVAFMLNTVLAPSGSRINPAGTLREVRIDPPAGFVANPLIAPRCPRAYPICENNDAIVGAADPVLSNYGDIDSAAALANVVPPLGSAAQFTFQASLAKVAALGRLRPEDYGVRALSPNLPGDYKPYGAIVTLWGEPGSPARDAARCVTAQGCGSSNPGSVTEAFLTNPTECSGSVLPTLMAASTWQDSDLFATDSYDSPAVTDCADVPFDPVVVSAATSPEADSASGLEFDVEVDQAGLLDPDSIAPSHLRDVTVDLPEGVAANPSGATGLQPCTDAQMAPGTDTVPGCPDGSKIGTVEITSPLVDQPVGGTMYFGSPKSTDPLSGEMLRLWVVARNDDLGVMIKLLGSAIADPQTGKLVATFENNPRLPFDHLSVELKGGERGVLAMPQTCGSRSIASTLSPWSGTTPVADSSPLDVAGDCAFGFGPKLTAGMSSRTAHGTGTFSFKFSREDGEQWVDGLTAQLPKGLLASVKDVPLCSSGQAAAGACPESSRIGSVDGAAGSGDPFVLEQKGSAYLTEGYKGCAYGLAVKVPVVAGPFDASSPETDLGDIVVRQKVCVDPTTAQVSVVSDRLPTIWHGIPLRIRSVTVNVDRPGFMLNPSGCEVKQVGASFHSERGATATAAIPFQASGCAGLPFKPKLTLALTGAKQISTGKHPGVKATVTQQGVGEAGIKQTIVRLPKSLALDPDNAQALCEFTDGTKPDLENHCPKGSIVGRARARTPLLRDDLVGNVYFVKNVRTDPKTGNQIRTLPMLIVALRGKIAINLKGESSTTRNGRLVNTFASIPDAPINQFNLNIQGGNNGILAVTRTRKAKINICASRQIAETDIDSHNGRIHDTNTRIKTPCTKKQVKRAKRAAKQAVRRR
jgi:hypothetical protein